MSTEGVKVPESILKRSHSNVRFDPNVDSIGHAAVHDDTRTVLQPTKTRKATGLPPKGQKAHLTSISVDNLAAELDQPSRQSVSDSPDAMDGIERSLKANKSGQRGFGAKLAGAMRLGKRSLSSHAHEAQKGSQATVPSHDVFADAVSATASLNAEGKYMSAPSMTEAFAPVFCDATSLFLPQRTYNANADQHFHKNLTSLPRGKSSFAAIVESAVNQKVAEGRQKAGRTKNRFGAATGRSNANTDEGDAIADVELLSMAVRMRMRELARLAKAKAKTNGETESNRDEERVPYSGSKNSSKATEDSCHACQSRANESGKWCDKLEDIEKGMGQQRATAAPQITFEPPTPIQFNLHEHPKGWHREIINEHGGDAFNMELRRESQDEVIWIGRDGQQIPDPTLSRNKYQDGPVLNTGLQSRRRSHSHSPDPQGAEHQYQHRHRDHDPQHRSHRSRRVEEEGGAEGKSDSQLYPGVQQTRKSTHARQQVVHDHHHHHHHHHHHPRRRDDGSQQRHHHRRPGPQQGDAGEPCGKSGDQQAHSSSHHHPHAGPAEVLAGEENDVRAKAHKGKILRAFMAGVHSPMGRHDQGHTTVHEKKHRVGSGNDESPIIRTATNDSSAERKRLGKIVDAHDETRLSMALDMARSRMEKELLVAKAEKRRMNTTGQSSESSGGGTGHHSRPSVERARKTMNALVHRVNSVAVHNDHDHDDMPSDQPSPAPTLPPERERAYIDEAYEEAIKREIKSKKEKIQASTLIPAQAIPMHGPL